MSGKIDDVLYAIRPLKDEDGTPVFHVQPFRMYGGPIPGTYGVYARTCEEGIAKAKESVVALAAVTDEEWNSLPVARKEEEHTHFLTLVCKFQTDGDYSVHSSDEIVISGEDEHYMTTLQFSGANIVNAVRPAIGALWRILCEHIQVGWTHPYLLKDFYEMIETLEDELEELIHDPHNHPWVISESLAGNWYGTEFTARYTHKVKQEEIDAVVRTEEDLPDANIEEYNLIRKRYDLD